MAQVGCLSGETCSLEVLAILFGFTMLVSKCWMQRVDVKGVGVKALVSKCWFQSVGFKVSLSKCCFKVLVSNWFRCQSVEFKE